MPSDSQELETDSSPTSAIASHGGGDSFNRQRETEAFSVLPKRSRSPIVMVMDGGRTDLRRTVKDGSILGDQYHRELCPRSDRVCNLISIAGSSQIYGC